MTHRLKRPDQAIYVPRHKRSSGDKIFTEDDKTPLINDACKCGGKVAIEANRKSPCNERRGKCSPIGRQTRTCRKENENINLSCEISSKKELGHSLKDQRKLCQNDSPRSSDNDVNLLPPAGKSPTLSVSVSNNGESNALINCQGKNSGTVSINDNSVLQKVTMDTTNGGDVDPKYASSSVEATDNELQPRLCLHQSDVATRSVSGRISQIILEGVYDDLLKGKQKYLSICKFSNVVSSSVLKDALKCSFCLLKSTRRTYEDVSNFSSVLSSAILIKALRELDTTESKGIPVEVRQQTSLLDNQISNRQGPELLCENATDCNVSDLKDFEPDSCLQLQNELSDSFICSGKQNTVLQLNGCFEGENGTAVETLTERTEQSSSGPAISRTRIQDQSVTKKMTKMKSKPLKKKNKKAVAGGPSTSPPETLPLSNKQERKVEEVVLDDWESNFDEEGECLQKGTYEISVLEDELYEDSDGQIDYLRLKPKEVTLDIGEFGHILELSEFPSSYKSSDLFRVMKAAGVIDYDLHWVDDTHAVAVFASQVAAHNALKVNMPFIQMKQVVNGARQSRIKCKDLKDSMLPYKKRPQTTSMVARNLVAGALGMRTNTTKEQRMKEKEMIKQAREEKRLKEKQRRDVWDS